MIADKFNTDHHKIKRILEKYNIEITNKGRKRKSSKGYKRKPFTEEHKRNISLLKKGEYLGVKVKPCQKKHYTKIWLHIYTEMFL